MATAVYLRNRSPTTTVKGMTPCEALTGEKPRVDTLRVFGCLAYTHIPKDERQNMYGEWVNLSQDNPEPSSVREEMASSNKSKWCEAMKKEMESLYENEVWDMVEPPKGRKIVGSKWVFKEKMGADGTTERYKAGLVAVGFSQKRGLDYDETFSPTYLQVLSMDGNRPQPNCCRLESKHATNCFSQ